MSPATFDQEFYLFCWAGWYRQQDHKLEHPLVHPEAKHIWRSLFYLRCPIQGDLILKSNYNTLSTFSLISEPGISGLRSSSKAQGKAMKATTKDEPIEADDVFCRRFGIGTEKKKERKKGISMSLRDILLRRQPGCTISRGKATTLAHILTKRLLEAETRKTPEWVTLYVIFGVAIGDWLWALIAEGETEELIMLLVNPYHAPGWDLGVLGIHATPLPISVE